MNRFIAAMDHSGGSTGGVLERYGQEYTEENKMDLVHQMRQRMIANPDFNGENISHAILYKDTVDRGIVPELKTKGIRAILKIDSGCEEDGTLKDFDVPGMCEYAINNGCVGTKMRSIVKSMDVIEDVLHQQFSMAQTISDMNLIPIVEPEIPIDHIVKDELERQLRKRITKYLRDFNGSVILKLTLPEMPDTYRDLLLYNSCMKIVGLSGGYTTEEACRRLAQNIDMTASFSRGLSEGLLVTQTDEEFNARLSQNITDIVEASSSKQV